jgi:hypothetical protein
MMAYSKPIVYGSIMGITVYNALFNPKLCDAWIYAVAPYALRRIYDKIINKYNISDNKYIETGVLGLSVYSLYKSNYIY